MPVDRATSEEVRRIVTATVLVLRQHLRLQPRGTPAATTITIDDLSLLVSARTALAVPREYIRNLINALAHAQIVRTYPAPKLFLPTSYSFESTGVALDAAVNLFLERYHPRRPPCSRTMTKTAALLREYEDLFRRRVGGLPRKPGLPEIALRARLNGTRWLERQCIRLAQRQAL